MLEPSIAFHTLINLRDSEDIANERIRTNDLSLEIKNLADKIDSNNIDDEEHQIRTINKNPNNKINHYSKNTVNNVIKIIILILQDIERNVMANIIKTKTLQQNFHNKRLGNTLQKYK